MRRASAGAELVRELSAAPELDGWAITERLLEGELTEIRAGDLRFSLAEARALFAAAAVELAGPVLEMLYARTEGWAAGAPAGRALPGRASGSGAVRGGVLRQ